MKVIHLTSGGDVGGAKTHVLSMLRELKKTDNVQLVCFSGGPFAEEAKELNIPTTVIESRNIFSATSRPVMLTGIRLYFSIFRFKLDCTT